MPPKTIQQNKKAFEDMIRDIIRDEFRNFDTLERYTFQKKLQIFDGRNIQVGKTTGTKIATATDQKLSVYGVTPVVQQSKINDPSGQATDLDAEARTAINAILDAIEAFGITASS